MSEQVQEPKKLEEMSRDELVRVYNECAARAGDLGFRIAVMNQEVHGFMKKMDEVNQAVDKLEKPSAAPAPVEAVVPEVVA